MNMCKDENSFKQLLLSKERNRKKKKYFPDYWLERNYLSDRAYELALKYFLGTINEQDSYLTTIAQPNRKEFWISRGYSMEDAIKKVSELQSNNNKKYINKYSKEERKKFQNTCIEYYLNNGNSLEESEKLLSERQSTFSHKKCIERYGVNGEKVFRDRQDKWQNTMNSKSVEEKKVINERKGVNLKNYIAKYGEEEGRKRYLIWLNEYLCRVKRNGLKRYSIESIIFFKKHIPEKIMEQSQYGDDEYYIRHEDKIFFYDFRYKNTIVEYHGSFYHFNPRKDVFESWSNPFGVSPEQSLEKDKLKRKIAEDKNFKYFEIYSNDDECVIQTTVKQILESINEET